MTKERRNACDEVLDLLTDHAEGLLSGKERTRVEEHLGSCRRCRTEAALVGGIVSRLHAIGGRQAPAALCANVMAALGRPDHGEAVGLLDRLRAFLTPRRALASAVVTAAVAVVALVPLYRLDVGGGAPQVAAVEAGRAVASRGGPTLNAGAVLMKGRALDVRDALALAPGATFTVQPGGTALLHFPDGSSVQAGQGAEIVVRPRGLELARGRLDLTMTENGVGFRVETPHADVVVRGTAYSVEVDQSTVVQVSRGKVGVHGRNAEGELLVQAGERVEVQADGRVSRGAATDPAGQALHSEDTRLGTTDEH